MPEVGEPTGKIPVFGWNLIEKPRTNKWSGECVKCGCSVPEGKGFEERNYQWYQKIVGGGYTKYLTWCSDCAALAVAGLNGVTQ